MNNIISLLPVMVERMKTKLTDRAFHEFERRLALLCSEEDKIEFTRKCFKALAQTGNPAENRSRLSKQSKTCCLNCEYGVENAKSKDGWMQCSIGGSGNFPKVVHRCRYFKPKTQHADHLKHEDSSTVF